MKDILTKESIPFTLIISYFLLKLEKTILLKILKVIFSTLFTENISKYFSQIRN